MGTAHKRGQALYYFLYETKIAGRNSLFYIHLEHQRTSDRTMAFRMLVYMVGIWEQYRLQYPGEDLPLVFPMVIWGSLKNNFT